MCLMLSGKFDFKKMLDKNFPVVYNAQIKLSRRSLCQK